MINVMIKSLVLALLIYLGTANIAHAYIDPSTGGMLVQVLATVFALLSGIVLVFFRQIRTVFARARRSLRRNSNRGVSEVEGEVDQSQRPEGD